MIERLRIFAISTILVSANFAGGAEFLNGNFDDGLQNWNVSPNATIDTKIYKTKELTGEGDSNKSLKIICAQKEGWEKASQNIDIEAGATYSVEAWLKLLDARQTHVKIEWFDKNGKFIKTSFICAGTDGTKDWFKVNGIVQAPDNAVKASLACLGGQGTTWLDAVSFVKTTSPIPQIGQEEWIKAVQKKYGQSMTAPEMKEKIIYYDIRHDVGWVSNIESLLAFFNARGFTTKNADDLKTWMQKKIKEGADGSVCVMAMGIVPDNITETMSTECTMKKYMDAGGRIVWIGDIPLFYKSFINKAPSEWNQLGNPRRLILGLKDGKWDISRMTGITETGKNWGMKGTDSPTRTMENKSVTLIFSEVADHSYTCSYFKNYNIEFPYSGFLRYRASGYDGSNSEQNEDLYRLALYRGKTIAVPAVKEEKKATVPALIVTTEFKNYPKGRDISISLQTTEKLKENAKIEIKDQDNKVIKTISNLQNNQCKINTKDMASGEYTIEARIVNGNKTPARNETKVLVVPEKNRKLPIGMFGVIGGTSEYKQDIVMKDLQEHLGECGIVNGGNSDAAAKHGLKIIPKSNAYYKSLPPREQDKELQMKVSNGNWPTYHYGGSTKAPLCFGNQLNRENVGNTLKEEIGRVEKYPAFANLMFFQDDVAMYGDPGEHRLACYCKNCKSIFKKLTGFEAPLAPTAEILKAKGIVKDNDLWYLWMKFRTKNVYGNWNKAMEDAKDSVNPAVRLVPSMGGWEVFSPQWALNPPDTFHGLDIVAFYHYPHLSRPCIFFRSQAALAMMGNRNKDYWGIPQSSDYANIIKDPFKHTMLVRNEFYYLVAAGAKGMVYFHYPPMPGTAAWEEFKNLSKFGTEYGPLFLDLKQAQPATAILTSYCNASYQWADGGTHYKNSEALYISLLKEHVATDMIADEEILDGDLKKYKVLLLTDIDYLTESEYKKIEEFIKKGGKVFCDKDCSLKIPGTEITPAASWASELKKLDDNQIEIDTPDISISEFLSGKARYLMLVNGCMEKPVTVKMTLKGIKGHSVYDITAGKLLNPKSIMNSLAFWKDDDTLESEITVDTAGGKLIGIYPAEIADISILSPADMTRGKKSLITIEIKDKDAKNIEALFPVKVTIIKPDGKESEYSDFYAIRNGKLELQILPAVNDMPGKWKIEVRELSSGKESGKSFKLE